MRLLTFNALFKGDLRRRTRAIGTAVGRGAYDVVCLQEVMYRWQLPLLRGSFPWVACSGAAVLKGGLVILSRWPVIRSEFTRFNRSGPVRPEFLMRKGVLRAVLAGPDGEVSVVNTHLSADQGPAVAQAELAQVAAGLPELGPLAVVGDFNQAAPVLAGLRHLPTGHTYRPVPAWPGPDPLDHIFVRGFEGQARVVLTEAEPGVGYLSDHYGVEALLTATL
jgi:endonuclease/exonuclease/phosphatase family metal-dependent hydrolase